MSTSVQRFTGQSQIHERRSHPRVLPRTLIYVACGESNGGMVLNVSDDGMAISMAIPVGDEAYSKVHVRMNGLAQSIEVRGRMAWTTKSKKRAGIQLVEVSEEQRGQIREWLAQQGVRDVNLLPRVSEAAVPVLPALPSASIIPTLVNEPPPNLSPVAVSAASNPAVSAEPHVSLLAGLGGTAPEFLGPSQEQPPCTEDTVVATQSSQGSNPLFAGFRENEWDLASVTMVPRKRSKPEGLSALGLLLLWIAIPSFGIGIIVGRRPLQQWLSRGALAGTSISRVATPEPEIVSVRSESPDITSRDIDGTGPQSISARGVETPATDAQDVKTPATKSFVSTPAIIDTKLLNSMSTQELRAVKSPVSTVAAENPNARELSRSKVDSKAELNAATKDPSWSAAVAAKLVTGTNISASSANAPTNPGSASAQRGDSKDKSATAPVMARDTQSIAINNEARVRGFAAPHSSAATVTSPSASRTASGSTATVSTVTASENSAAQQSTAGSTPSILAVGNAPAPSPGYSVSQVSRTTGNSTVASSPINDASRNSNTVFDVSKTQSTLPSSATTPSDSAPSKSVARIASDITPRNAPNVRPSMASAATAGTPTKDAPRVNAFSPRPVAPGGASNLAPVNAQAPLHGVMLVARKNNESFLLRLPVESAADGRSVSVQMQRSVMVPAESRWHHHGPIAKLEVGELLTQVATLETASSARPGDAVTVRAFIDKNGSVQDLKPVSGRFAVMPRVMRDVREWQFDQTLIDGKAVESEINITIEFRSGRQPTGSREIQAQNSFKP